MVITDEPNGFFVFIKARGSDILLKGLKKTKKHAYQCIQSGGREISTINWVARVF